MYSRLLKLVFSYNKFIRNIRMMNTVLNAVSTRECEYHSVSVKVSLLYNVHRDMLCQL